MDAGIHLPLIDLSGVGFSYQRLAGAVDAARDCGFAAIAANDHFLFATPWLDGPTALAAVAGRASGMELATTVTLVTLRGPVPLAKTLAALDVLSEGRLVAGVGPGSSAQDYAALGVPFEQRWRRLDEAVILLRALLRGERSAAPTHYSAPDGALLPAPVRPGGIPLWIGSWGSPAGLRRVARLGDGWLSSAYNTTPRQFAANLAALGTALDQYDRAADGFPNAVATMWTWVTEDEADATRVLTEILAPLLNRDPTQLGERLCVGSAAHCAEVVAHYAAAGCRRMYFWPIADEPRQIERLGTDVLPAVHGVTLRPAWPAEGSAH